MMNFIAVIICMVGAVLQAIKGDFWFCLLEIMFVLLNLPYAIQWYVDIKHRKANKKVGEINEKTDT